MFNKTKLVKYLKIMAASPFILMGIFFFLLVWALMAISLALVYMIAILMAIKFFIYDGKWKFEDVLEDRLFRFWRR